MDATRTGLLLGLAEDEYTEMRSVHGDELEQSCVKADCQRKNKGLSVTEGFIRPVS